MVHVRLKLCLGSSGGRHLGIIRIFKQIKDFWEDIESLETIAETALVKSFLWPTVLAACTAASGEIGHQPLMWILMASALVFMAMTTATLNLNVIKQINTPLNKIQYWPIYNMDLASVPVPTARGISSRKLAITETNIRMLGPIEIVDNVKRTIKVSQLGIEILNTATFPISCILFYADTSVEGVTPPRTAFPKGPYMIPAGSKYKITDERIPMNDFPCGKLAGTVDITIKYGRPGKEKFEFSVKGNVEIMIEENGKFSGLSFAPQQSAQSPSVSNAT